jgi:hypothetical protein
MNLIGTMVKHYKGKYYRILEVADHTETRQQMVIYEQLYKNEYPKGYVWCRPLDMFNETLIYNNKIVKRFEVVDDDELIE